MRKKTLVTAIIAIVMLASCGPNKNDMLGHWILEEEYTYRDGQLRYLIKCDNNGPIYEVRYSEEGNDTTAVKEKNMFNQELVFDNDSVKMYNLNKGVLEKSYPQKWKFEKNKLFMDEYDYINDVHDIYTIEKLDGNELVMYSTKKRSVVDEKTMYHSKYVYKKKK